MFVTNNQRHKIAWDADKGIRKLELVTKNHHTKELSQLNLQKKGQEPLGMFLKTWFEEKRFTKTSYRFLTDIEVGIYYQRVRKET